MMNYTEIKKLVFFTANRQYVLWFKITSMLFVGYKKLYFTIKLNYIFRRYRLLQIRFVLFLNNIYHFVCRFNVDVKSCIYDELYRKQKNGVFDS